MNEEKINYWLEVFRDNKYAFMSKDGLVIPFYTAIEQLKQLEHNWNELKKWLEEKEQNFRKDIYGAEYGYVIGTLVSALSKMQSLEEGGNNE